MTTATRVEAAAMMRASWWKVREPAMAFSEEGRTGGFVSMDLRVVGEGGETDFVAPRAWRYTSG